MKCEQLANLVRQDRGKETPDEWRERTMRHAKAQLEDELAKDIVAVEAELRRQDLFDREIAAIAARKDLTEEQRRRRIEAIKALAAARLNGGGSDVPTTPKVL